MGVDIAVKVIFDCAVMVGAICHTSEGMLEVRIPERRVHAIGDDIPGGAAVCTHLKPIEVFIAIGAIAGMGRDGIIRWPRTCQG